MALAVPAAGGVQAAFGTQAKSLQVGFATQAGVRAAAQGGPALVLTRGPWMSGSGWWGAHQVGWTTHRPCPAGWPSSSTPAATPCSARSRPSATCGPAVNQDNSDGGIERVVVATPRATVQPLIHDRPRSGLEGKFSMPYAIATAILDDYPGFGSFSDAAGQPRACPGPDDHGGNRLRARRPRSRRAARRHRGHLGAAWLTAANCRPSSHCRPAHPTGRRPPPTWTASGRLPIGRAAPACPPDLADGRLPPARHPARANPTGHRPLTSPPAPAPPAPPPASRPPPAPQPSTSQRTPTGGRTGLGRALASPCPWRPGRRDHRPAPLTRLAPARPADRGPVVLVARAAVVLGDADTARACAALQPAAAEIAGAASGLLTACRSATTSPKRSPWSARTCWRCSLIDGKSTSPTGAVKFHRSW